MELKVESRAGRRTLGVVAALIYVFLLAIIVKAYVASALAQKPTVRNLQWAIRLDPRNPNYHLALGRLYEYLPTSTQPEKAVEEFRRAAELSPYDPQPWLDLAAAAEFQGNVTEAEAYLSRADHVAPNLPIYQWPIGNYYLLHGNVTEAFRHLRVVLAGTRTYDQILFSTAWKASGNPTVILDQLIPPNWEAEFSYLYYLLAQKQYAEALPVWKRIAAGPDKFPARQVGGYMETLIGAHRPAEAYEVWTDMQKKGLIRRSGDDKNLISDGDFEDEILDFGFGWRVAPVEGVYAGPDTTDYHSPSHSLLIQFSGNANLNYHQVYEYVKVEPGTSYRLQGYVKTEGITTDSGPRLEVRDAYDPGALAKSTEAVTGTSNGWTSLLLDFKTGPQTELLVVGLARLPSSKLDNLIAGKVWLDDVRLTASE